ncbi:hypothetical protein [Vreelandella piezotolerans]|uniref:hypothetical protein n=1 Tax=Vreelandella piezotolerans TaxID=2609667 RepID=UPI0037968560
MPIVSVDVDVDVDLDDFDTDDLLEELKSRGRNHNGMGLRKGIAPLNAKTRGSLPKPFLKPGVMATINVPWSW